MSSVDYDAGMMPGSRLCSEGMFPSERRFTVGEQMVLGRPYSLEGRRSRPEHEGEWPDQVSVFCSHIVDCLSG
jgi:hypothetical protein